MADSDSDTGSGAGRDEFDPTNLDGMSEKERKKMEKDLDKWRIFMDFLVRHIAITTFRYNCFEHEDLQQFMLALERGENVRSKVKLKKGEDVRISTFKVMRDTTDMMVQERYVNEANQIRKFLDIAGRLRGICAISSGFYTALKKSKVSGLDKIKYYLDYWKGFTVRTYDYRELRFKGVDPDSFNELEKKYLVWPTVVRTGIQLSQRFLKKTSESTGLELLSPDPQTIQKHMQAAEFVIATKIEDMLFQRVAQDSKSVLSLGKTVFTSIETNCIAIQLSRL